ncbi:MAG: glycoside hydrolase family 16 protein [Acidomyces sp. 'richmondensis']|nr:MAG: glycoside hydrolase family 16 protein [Acidomyces sp. 'richmondensis']
MHFSRSTAAAALVAIPAALAQTSTSCNPLDTTCPEDTGLDSQTFVSDFTQGSSAAASWSMASGTTLTYGNQGAEFIISKAGEAPTISTDFYFLFGRVDIKMQAAPGTGIVSSVVLESDDLDEIDLEWLGGDTTQVETNFFGKGNTTTYNRATYQSVSSPQTTMHTYSVDWTSERIEWLIDDAVVRTVPYNDPLALGGKNYPQTPMRLKLGNWCGGCSGEPEGTVEWAGGHTTFNDAPYIMYVESVSITNYNPAKYYKYGNKSGSWQSIEIINGTSTSSATGSGTVTATAGITNSAPTSSISVVGISAQSGAIVHTTVTGSGSMTAVASTGTGTPYANSTMATGSGVATATTEVPGASASATVSGPSRQSATNGASAHNVLTAGSLLSIALCFFML